MKKLLNKIIIKKLLIFSLFFLSSLLFIIPAEAAHVGVGLEVGVPPVIIAPAPAAVPVIISPAVSGQPVYVQPQSPIIVAQPTYSYPFVNEEVIVGGRFHGHHHRH